MANPSHSPETLARLLAGGPTGDEQSVLLWAMSVKERAAAMRRDQLSLGQLTECSSAYPQEVPLIAGEYRAWRRAPRRTRLGPRRRRRARSS